MWTYLKKKKKVTHASSVLLIAKEHGHKTIKSFANVFISGGRELVSEWRSLLADKGVDGLEHSLFAFIRFLVQYPYISYLIEFSTFINRLGDFF